MWLLTALLGVLLLGDFAYRLAAFWFWAKAKLNRKRDSPSNLRRFSLPCRLFATDKSSDLIFFYWYVQNWMRLMIGGEYWVGGSVKDVSLVRKRKE